MAAENYSFIITGINYILIFFFISQYHCFYWIFDQINAALVSMKDQNKTKKSLPQTFDGNVLLWVYIN